MNRPRDLDEEPGGEFAPGAPLDSETLGASLEDAGSDVFQGESGPVRARWLRSPFGVEIVSWRDEFGRLLQAQLALRGEVVQWSEKSGVQTGLVVEEEVGFGPSHESVRYDSSPVVESVVRASDVVRGTLALEDSERDEILARFASLARGGERAAPALAILSPASASTVRKAPRRSLWAALKFLATRAFRRGS